MDGGGLLKEGLRRTKKTFFDRFAMSISGKFGKLVGLLVLADEAKTKSEGSRKSAAAAGEDASGGSGSSGKQIQDEEGEDIDWDGMWSFMKRGGCKERFIAWDKCIEDAEKGNEDVREQCSKVAAALHRCMQAHSDHYLPILKMQKAGSTYVREIVDLFSDLLA